SQVDTKERHYLFWNINQIYCFPKSVEGTTIEKVLQNPLQFTNKDVLITSVQNTLDEAKGALLKATDLALTRAGKIEVLIEKTENLQNTCIEFHKRAKETNRSCCFGYMPRFGY